MRSAELKAGVSGREIAATVHFPDEVAPSPVVVFASPGGGYGRRYFDLRIAGAEDYSQARRHTDEGIVFVAYDHLGVGDSSPGAIDQLTIEDIADANHAGVMEILARLRAGDVLRRLADWRRSLAA